MKIPVFVVNAFTTQPFGGNPAAVCPLTRWLPDATMAQIAAQHNLSETAFFVLEKNKPTHLRWWTPTTEVDFCGHATLASAEVILRHLELAKEEIIFDTRRGLLSVKKKNAGYEMTLPIEKSVPVEMDDALVRAMGCAPAKIFQGANMMLVYDSQQKVESLRPNFSLLKAYCAPRHVGIIATAPATSKDIDFVSRFFAPAHGVAEDPVTGSAHCQLTPYWTEQMGKETLVARQISARQGELTCRQKGGAVLIEGSCTTFSVGEITLPR